ncbi:MAG: hypothetical protein Q4G54_03410 [Pelistega sp.]|nr:hypothetical protein [Pelistega sp.]
MTTIAIIAHTPIASALLAGVQHVFPAAERVFIFDILPDDEPDAMVTKVLEQLKDSAPEQVLIFTDLIGATPSNIGVRVAQSLNAAHIKTELLTGTNICMLLSAVRYRDMPIEQLQDKVIEAGKRGMQSIDCDGGDACL